MRIHIHTFGCQMNVNDSETMMGILSSRGHTLVDNPENADVVILNTCAVRKKAEDKFYGKLGELNRLRKAGKEFIVGVAGCIAEKSGKELLERKDVHFVLGTRAVSRIDEIVERASRGEKVADFEDALMYINAETPRIRQSKHHAWVTIIYGCDKFCSYCIVPYTRGREKSRPLEDVIREVKDLAHKGYREVTFLGQNVDSYGKDLGDGTSLARLLQLTEKIEGIERIWFLTSYPSDFSSELIDTIASSQKVAKSIHLPVQSGSDRILKAMNRGYTREEYVQLIQNIREKIGDVSISTDVIVGFPGETEEDFEQTYRLLEELRFERVNLAMYSPREGTVAWKHLEDNVPKEVKNERLQTLLELQKRINSEINRSYLDKVVRIIGEGRLDKKRFYGRTEKNKIVIFCYEDDPTGRFIDVKITKTTAGPLYGEVVWIESPG